MDDQQQHQDSSQSWQVKDRFVELRSPWMTLIGEHWQDQTGKSLVYWRIEKADSVIIVPIQVDRFLLPHPSYRPGVGMATLDFPGGRIPAEQSPQQAAIVILQRELGIEAAVITQLTPLNHQGWPVNSSFSNQRLYGFVAHLRTEAMVSPEFLGACYPTHAEGVTELLKQLLCLQCRAVLLEWWRQVRTIA